MPEGDSVYQLSKRLQFLRGREVLATSLRVPSVALTRFDGERVQRLWPYGKHLFMQFSGGNILHTHLKMEGTWAIHRLGDKWPKQGHLARVVLQFRDEPRPIEVIGFELGLVEVFPASSYAEKMGYLGPDVLYPDWEEYGKMAALRRIAARPERPIGSALLDQKNLAGVGNEYRAEICFLAGIHPGTPVAHVDVPRVLAITRRVMWENRNSPIRVTTGVKRAGENSYVFGRHGQPCRRCGTPILKDSLQWDPDELERIVWWCPNCQLRG
ncbi:DNA-formamidopyrimidine glycosylase family protein [Corynebacterium sp. H128]|uniref:DNA-formamidopyrimidine glycosylase family protein n=1 Tax=Corynebacterium sp. H128 TaxID=3133427 RepID=UPI0030A7D543